MSSSNPAVTLFTAIICKPRPILNLGKVPTICQWVGAEPANQVDIGYKVYVNTWRHTQLLAQGLSFLREVII